MLVVQRNYDLHHCLMNNKQLYHTLFYCYSNNIFIRPPHRFWNISTYWSNFCLYSILSTISTSTIYRFTILWILAFYIARPTKVDYIKSLIGAADWLSPSERNILVRKMYVQITKTEGKLFNTKHKITSWLLVILGDFDFSIISQHNTLTLQYRAYLLLKKNRL